MWSLHACIRGVCTVKGCAVFVSCLLARTVFQEKVHEAHTASPPGHRARTPETGLGRRETTCTFWLLPTPISYNVLYANTGTLVTTTPKYAALRFLNVHHFKARVHRCSYAAMVHQSREPRTALPGARRALEGRSATKSHSPCRRPASCQQTCVRVGLGVRAGVRVTLGW